MADLLTAAQRAAYQAALDNLFDTFKRDLEIFVEAQTAVISTSPTYSRFGQHDQNAAITVDNTAVTPQSFIIQGCILYGAKQPWLEINPGGDSGGNTQMLKIKNGDGTVRIKVEQDGYDLLYGCKLIKLDGFTFQLNSTPRPHGLVGAPTRWTFTAELVQ